MIKVCFICHGNICRSVMAEFILKEKLNKLNKADDFYVFSRAVSNEEYGNDIYPEAKHCLSKHNIPYERHYAKKVRIDELVSSDYIFVMDDNNLYYLGQQFAISELSKVKKLLLTDIEDPWYTGNFEKVYQQINEGIDGFLQKLHIM